MRNRLYILLLLILPLSFYAQKSQYTLNEDRSRVSLVVDNNHMVKLALSTEDVKRGQPLLESKLYSMNINMDTVGVWTQLADKENVWRLNIHVPDAKGFIISFDDFYLPEGSSLYVYDEKELNNAIVYSNEDNPKGGAYSIENIVGDNVMLEYVAHNQEEKPRLHFSEIGYKYETGVSTELSGYGESGDCMINVNCPEGDFWGKQKKGVLHLRVRRGSNTYLCSGSLVNNTNQDKTPYVLSAYHCFQYMSLDQIRQTEFFFEYQSPGCENERPKYKYHKGADPLVLNPINTGSDGALLTLADITGVEPKVLAIPSNWDVYYNGWDRTNDANNITSGTIIHHPEGDIKKITLYNKNPISGQWSESDETPNDTHWIVTYSSGATAGGSSGAPLFNQNGLIVGTLTGGDNGCSALTKPDYYGKLWYHWDQGTNADWHMDKYLDPNNTGVTKLEGLAAIEGTEPEPTDQPELFTYIDNGTLRIYAKDILRKVKVCDLSGRIVYSKTTGLSSSIHDISVSDWRNGVYIVSVNMDGRSSTKSIKIIK